MQKLSQYFLKKWEMQKGLAKNGAKIGYEAIFNIWSYTKFFGGQLMLVPVKNK